MGLFARGEKLCASAKALLAARAVETSEWSREGARSAEEWLAGRWGTSQSSAEAGLKAARVAARQPQLDDAMRHGELSAEQASEIAGAAEVDEAATGRLLEQARTRSLKGLKEQARAVRLAGRSSEDDQARADRLHQGRYLRYWTDREGAGRIDGRLAPDRYAEFLALLAPFEKETMDTARKEGRREGFSAYKADALMAMARASQGGGGDRPVRVPKEVIAVIDHAALVRGHVEGEERSYIDGVGPVPVSTIVRMIASDDPFLAAVVADGTDICAVCVAGRTVTRKQKMALMVRDRHCVVPGCDVDQGLEIDHFPPFEQSQHTRVDELRRLCAHHHDQITYWGAALTGRPGHWVWTPPPPGPFDDPYPFPDPFADAGPDPFADPGRGSDPPAVPHPTAPSERSTAPHPPAACRLSHLGGPVAVDAGARTGCTVAAGLEPSSDSGPHVGCSQAELFDPSPPS
jgi:hypothetical protein